MKTLICLILSFTSVWSGKTIYKPKPCIVAVLCDVSRSVSKLKINEKSKNNSQINILKEFTKQIPYRFAYDSQIYYFQVSSSATSKPIGGSAIVRKRVTLIEKDHHDRTLDSSLNHINSEIDNLASNSKTTENSCILTSIANAYRFLSKNRNRYGSRYEYQIIVLSDMLEFCNSFSDFNVNLETKYGLKSATTNVDKIMLNNIDLKSQNINVIIASISKDMTEKELALLQNFWNKVFKKMNYSEDVIISSSL